MGRFGRLAQQVPRYPVVALAAKEERKRGGDALWQIDRYGHGNHMSEGVWTEEKLYKGNRGRRKKTVC